MSTQVSVVKFVSAILLLIASATASCSAGQDRSCTPAEVKKARREVSRLQDWNAVYDSFKHFPRCDRGRLAEEYSYAVSRLLAHDWADLAILLSLAANDQSFKAFVLQHLDENIPEEEAQLIVRNSRQHCPTEGEWLCKAIADY